MRRSITGADSEDRILPSSANLVSTTSLIAGSRVRIELALDPPVATGSWTETTAPDGYYRGATYHGALQLVIDPSRRHMSGRWLGFGRDFTVNTGEWTLTWEEGSTAKSVQRRYHERV